MASVIITWGSFDVLQSRAVITKRGQLQLQSWVIITKTVLRLVYNDYNFPFQTFLKVTASQCTV